MVEHMLSILKCPYCGGRFGFDQLDGQSDLDTFGILICSCDSFPVIAGIPILKTRQLGPLNISKEKILEQIKKKDRIGALLSVITPLPIKQKFIPGILKKYLPERGLHRIGSLFWIKQKKQWHSNVRCIVESFDKGTSVEELLQFYFCLPGVEWMDMFDYFFYRYSQPRHLAALNLIHHILQEKTPVLEVGCGFGHMTRTILNRVKFGLVVGVDAEFFPLYVAKKIIGPRGNYICIDVESGLPFQDNVFDASVMCDGIHYVENKVSCLNELSRISTESRLHLFISSRNQLTEYPLQYAGRPLTPNGYANLLGKLPYRIISDSTIVESYLSKEGPNLEVNDSFEKLNQESLLSLIVSKNTSVFKKNEGFNSWPHISDSSFINPLYKTIDDGIGSKIRLKLSYPSEWYRKDNQFKIDFLPNELEVDRDVVLNSGKLSNHYQVQQLTDQLVLIDLPHPYQKKTGPFDS